jgi:hypothetical protein
MGGSDRTSAADHKRSFARRPQGRAASERDVAASWRDTAIFRRAVAKAHRADARRQSADAAGRAELRSSRARSGCSRTQQRGLSWRRDDGPGHTKTELVQISGHRHDHLHRHDERRRPGELCRVVILSRDPAGCEEHRSYRSARRRSGNGHEPRKRRPYDTSPLPACGPRAPARLIVLLGEPCRRLWPVQIVMWPR